MITVENKKMTMDDLLFKKFAYKLSDCDDKRHQSLRNAYILFGFNALRKKLEKISNPMYEKVLSDDIQFLKDEEKRIT